MVCLLQPHSAVVLGLTDPNIPAGRKGRGQHGWHVIVLQVRFIKLSMNVKMSVITTGAHLVRSAVS